ncbi:MAG: M14 family metallocarboxypeptidase [Oscillospiraceae bacterium]|nr:M14 family metallocarboxypeptidase [Oscillospiraceae bacterium]
MLEKFNAISMDENNRKEFIEKLIKKYKFIKQEVLSKSLCQRDINYIQIGNLDRAPVLFVGATHGMEWITSSLLLYFLRDICNIFENNGRIVGVNLKSFFKKNALIVIPCLNPDGVEIQINGASSAGKYSHDILKLSDNTNFWQANARGVDINHNFDAGWEEVHELEQKAKIFNPAPTRYGGEKPFSEPESLAIKEICNKIKFRHVISFHSQGREIFWDYANFTPKESLPMAQLMSYGSNYSVSRPTGLAIGAGLKDWFIKEFNRPGFTIEVGLGSNPLPISDLPKIFDELFESMALAMII